MKTTGTFFLKKDNLQLGMALGFVLPLVVFLLIYLVRFSESSLTEFIQTFAAQKGLITFFGVWCLVSNIALFTYYVNTQKDKTAKGIFAITLLYGIGILLAKVLI
ncbi:PH domain-containing protein [Flavisolibacter nicotianae]|uniref:hypothetical protein n=1 Tax=Flavisolibacter nicotianae TaxID=2364882 RepID=UPI0013C487D9|nr:hypothetical protein [Flavisolibacter nicotianae]